MCSLFDCCLLFVNLSSSVSVSFCFCRFNSALLACNVPTSVFCRNLLLVFGRGHGRLGRERNLKYDVIDSDFWKRS